MHSFYTDMVLAACSVCTPAKTYANCLLDFSRIVSEGQCGSLKDPCRISGTIHAADTEPQRKQLVNATEYAHHHANVAVKAKARRDKPPMEPSLQCPLLTCASVN